MSGYSETRASHRVASLIPTRESLLSRLRDWNDQVGWKEFFDTYWKLIYATAARAGLNDAESQDVVQETVISVMKSIPNFVYDPKRGTFKGWLLRLTRWRIRDQVRRRMRPHAKPFEDETDALSVMGDIPDTGAPNLEDFWEAEWEQNLKEAAIDRIKRKVDAKQFQIYDLLVVQRLTANDIVKALGVSRGLVYLTKHRIGKMLKKELGYLKTKYS